MLQNSNESGISRNGNSDFRFKLQAELLTRSRLNPSYSLRAFSRDLGIESSRLSKILRGQRPVGTALFGKIAAKLKMTDEEICYYSNTIKNKGSSNSNHDFKKYRQISQDTFEFIEDWHHYAILELLKLNDFQPKNSWIAKKLGISPVEAEEYSARLFRSGLLQKNSDGSWQDSSDGFSTDILSDLECTKAHSRAQQAILQLACKTIDTTPLTERDQSSMMMATSQKKIIQAKQMIKKFRRDLTEFLEDTQEKDSVFQLSISLFPLTHSEKKAKPSKD